MQLSKTAPSKIHKYISKRLLLRKTWNFLRYLHAKHALDSLLERHPGSVKTVLVIGCGTGLAELLLAAENPDIEFTLTDHEAASHKTDGVRSIQSKFDIKNVTWSKLNALNPDPIDTTYDLVYSIEVLEHIEDDKQVAKNMHRLSNKYIFCLVPFSEETRNMNPVARKKAWDRNEHHVCGYNTERLIQLFPSIINVNGCYWKEYGFQFRQKLTELTAEQITEQSRDLQLEAHKDLVNEIPTLISEAQGIWILAKNKP